MKEQEFITKAKRILNLWKTGKITQDEAAGLLMQEAGAIIQTGTRYKKQILNLVQVVAQ